MGTCFSSNDRVEPNEVTTIPKSTNLENEDWNPLSKQRRCTDVLFLFVIIIFIIGLFFLVFYCMSYGDIYRIINGYDDCANICGRENIVPGTELPRCQGTDMRNKKYLLIRPAVSLKENPLIARRECVSDCNEQANYRTFINRCIPEQSEQVVNSFFAKTGISDFFQEVSEDLHMCWKEILYLSLIALVFTIIIMVLFRYVIGFVVWFILVGVVIATVAGTIYLWVMWKQTKDILKSQNTQSDIDNRMLWSYFAYAILATVATVIILLLILVMRKRISLVIQLFKEAGKAVSSMPLIIFQPLFTFVALAVAITIWFYFMLWIESAGILTTKTNPDSSQPSLNYEKNTVMKLARWYNLFALFWITQFFIGCQHTVIAGAVSMWYFTRNKNKLDSPIITSTANLLKFHLGTISLGSMLIALVQLLRAILKNIEYYLKGRDNAIVDCILKCCQCCLYCFEKILSALCRNAYIMTAIYGHSFCRAGKQAFNVLASNALRVVAINSVGDFVLFLGKVLVVMATVLIGMELVQKKEGLHHMWVPLALAGCFAYLIAHCFITVYEMSIDTIFICFCEDCEKNDGGVRPYYMSRGLMDFVQNSKKAMAAFDKRARKSSDTENDNSRVWTTNA